MGYIDVHDENGYERIELPSTLVATNGGRFRLLGAIRGGGNGVVFRATRVSTGAEVAVKVLRQLFGSRIDRFENEVRILAELRHALISSYFGHGQYAAPSGWNVPWVAMELGGDNLRARVEQSGALTGTSLSCAVESMCAALQHIHNASWIHRDVKPDNFVVQLGTTHVQMIDFGIAKRANENVAHRPLDSFTRQQEFVGPLAYASPELIAYSRDKSFPVDYRSDLFQLGKVFWFLVTGRTTAGVPSVRLDPTGGRLRSVMVQLLSDEPEDRHQSADEVRVAVLGALSPP